MNCGPSFIFGGNSVSGYKLCSYLVVLREKNIVSELIDNNDDDELVFFLSNFELVE